MTDLLFICGTIGLLLIIAILAPFIHGPGGALQDAAGDTSPDILKNKQTALLERWIADEQSHTNGLITQREWNMRQVYLTNRYIDVTRRLEWLVKEQGE